MSDDELLDVLTAEGDPIGVKSRAAVHRDGDWHRCVHVWVVGNGGVLLQRRASTKSAWPGRLDATAAGHLTAGETVEDGLREVEEELGVVYGLDELVDLGVHRVDERDATRWNRELQHVFAAFDPRPLAAWTAWDRTELDGLVRIPAAAFTALVHDGAPTLGEELDADGSITRRPVTRGEVVPAPYLPVLAARLACLGSPASRTERP